MEQMKILVLLGLIEDDLIPTDEIITDISHNVVSNIAIRSSFIVTKVP